MTNRINRKIKVKKIPIKAVNIFLEYSFSNTTVGVSLAADLRAVIHPIGTDNWA
ncbi:hypothetical protein [Flavivirga rizhaonensis]|uniref:hypothetical protein n=1 Tax=Flavivirga rizhaonensis TaxID=2559571 RepID=UPI001476D25F|nr:hypothetical protein [Flavivirga rizhaonensis]